MNGREVLLGRGQCAAVDQVPGCYRQVAGVGGVGLSVPPAWWLRVVTVTGAGFWEKSAVPVG